MRKPQFDYLARQRHILLDMHVPDWDAGFLARFDAETMADNYQRAGAQAVMHYCNSHVGLNYWPSALGAMHRGLQGRDMVGETVEALHRRGIASCAYYSSYFNNWAWTNHPEWRLEGAGPGTYFGPKSRYGVCCPCSAEYHAFQLAQVEELVRTYPFDAIFFDMVFWTDICICRNCQGRFMAEAGHEIPGTVDWNDPVWCAFATARERWLADAFVEVSDKVKEHADIPVFSNITCIDKGWRQGVGLSALRGQDLLGGDFGIFGNDTYTASHLMTRVTPSVMQYMNAFTGYIGGASYMVEPEEQLTHHALVSLLFGGQFMAIDAVESDGTVNPDFYDGLRAIFDEMAPYQDYLGGKPMADVAVYFSDTSRMNLEENGAAISTISGGAWGEPPHLKAMRGAVKALRMKHIPVGVITKNQLGEIDRYPVVVLPSVIRMGDNEIAAFRGYVERGGKLYASGLTSQMDLDGTVRPDFGLADVFGCQLQKAEAYPVSYVRPAHPALGPAIHPRRVVSHGSPRSTFAIHPSTVADVRPGNDAETLATLDMPFGNGIGSREDEEWSSIHASPPYVQTERPVILRRTSGAGEVVYSAADLEANWPLALASEYVADNAPAALFASLIELMLGERKPRFQLDADMGVLAVGFEEDGGRRMRLHIANIPPTMPVRPVPHIGITVRPPEGMKLSKLTLAPHQESLAHTVDPEGAAHAELTDLKTFALVVAEFEPA